MKKVLIIGAGPAGLTAALELLREGDYQVTVLESSDCVGGISRTVVHNGNCMDIGGHRFFSKNDWVMDWWRNILPIAPDLNEKGLSIVPEKGEFFLVRSRLSRIFFLKKYFDYPISLSVGTLKNLGFQRVLKIGFSYCKAAFFKIVPEKNLEDFFVNRFGVELYKTFFKDYTEKVWGVSCKNISPSWGGQRIKGLSVRKALLHALASLLRRQDHGVSQKKIETSLIERFLYPMKGPGQLWTRVKDEVLALGGTVLFGQTVNKIYTGPEGALAISSIGTQGEVRWELDYLISSMPMRDLISAFQGPVPEEVKRVAEGLIYRDFITIGVLVKKLKQPNVLDTWVYIQEPEVKMGRLQIFNNWSPCLVRDPDTVWLGLEYFCQENDELWSMSDFEFSSFAIRELVSMGFIDKSDVLDSHVERVSKAYPAYFGTYQNIDVVEGFINDVKNVYAVGRNGMHRYNNQDHSMLSAKLAVDSICGRKKKDSIWSVNAEEAYHEEK